MARPKLLKLRVEYFRRRPWPHRAQVRLVNDRRSA